MLAKLKSPWERGGFPLKCDRQILELLKSLKTRFDKERKRRSMTDDEERRVAENFSSTTLNLVPVVEATAADFTKVKFTLSSNLELDD